MWRNKLFLGIVFLAIFLIAIPTVKAEVVEVIFSDDFETGLGNWSVSNGVWELCLRAEPDPDLGLFYVGTKCGENYPNYTDSQLITPNIDLTNVNIMAGQEVHLRFWQWFSYYPYDVNYSQDWGQVQISIYDEETGWSEWKNVGNRIQDYSTGWSLKSIDLTEYEDKLVRISFYHSSDEGDVRSGWFIDDVQVAKIVPEFDGTFEGGWDDWYADRGVWQVGTPTSGPGAAYSGFQCAGTVLNGDYPDYTDSRLISPTYALPLIVNAEEEVHLRFWQWFSYYPYDVNYSQDWGQVQISIYDEETGWSEWKNVGNRIQDYSTGWSLKSIDLTEYEDKLVRISFYHSSDEGDVRSGWFIDDIEIIKNPPKLTWDFECGWDDWYADRGVWQVGTPTSEPGTAYSGSQCAGTLLNGNYPDYTDSRLISPTIDLPAGCGTINLRFWQWFSYYPYDVNYSQDWGQVQISIYDEETGWSEWKNVGNRMLNSSGGWSQKLEDLTEYAGQLVRISFYHLSDEGDVSSGWFIDHVGIYCDSDNYFPHFCECDLNHDGSCDMQDWLLFGERWGWTGCCDPGVDCKCDLNHDCKCDMLDWLRFGENWGQTDCLICE